MVVFRVEKKQRLYRYEQPLIYATRSFLKGKGLVVAMLSLPEDWDYTLRDCPLSTGKIDAIREAVWELENADIYSVQGNVMRKDAYAVQRMLSMSSRLSLDLPTLETHWIIQHWKSLC